LLNGGRRGPMVFGFTTTYAISTYKVASSNRAHATLCDNVCQ